MNVTDNFMCINLIDFNETVTWIKVKVAIILTIPKICTWTIHQMQLTSASSPPTSIPCFKNYLKGCWGARDRHGRERKYEVTPMVVSKRLFAVFIYLSITS